MQKMEFKVKFKEKRTLFCFFATILTSISLEMAHTFAQAWDVYSANADECIKF